MTTKKTGSITLLVLVFGSIFFSVLVALSGFVLAQNKAQDNAREHATAFQLAEAGIEYYRWFLSHFPGDTTDGTGESGPYVTTYNDPEGGTVGTYSLSISANKSCGQVQSISVTSTGTPADDSSVSSTIKARYAAPSVAAYSYIVNSSVWAGPDRIINGPYHSNGGIRMDGIANAPVTSSLSTWDCTSKYGCSSRGQTEPGVFGSGGNQDLWKYPTPQVDFAGIAANFSSLKTTAESSGIYLPRYSSGSGSNSHRGYHLVFNSDGTITVYKVTSVTPLNDTVPIYNNTEYVTDYSLIDNETYYETLPIPSDCGLVFVEDNTWVEGTIPSKMTLVVANVSDVGVTPEVVLKGDIKYASDDGTDGFTLIAQDNILIAPDSPENMTLDGVFVAEGGAFGRSYYGDVTKPGWRGGTYGCDGTYEPRGTLRIFGTTVSNLETGTQWENGCTDGNAGYLTRIDSFDRTLSTDPPPFTPMTSTQWQFVDWQEES